MTNDTTPVEFIPKSLKLNEMEDWVSAKLERPFKLENYNTSRHVESNVKLDSYFKSKYNLIYDIHDIRKSNKTLV